MSTPAGGLAAPAARRSIAASRTPRSIAAVTALFAALLLVAATTGPWPGLVAGVQTSLVPDAAARGAVRGLAVSVSIGLLLLTRGLARRQRRAWAAAVVLCSTATVLFVLRDVDVASAFVAGLLLICLVHWRADFFAVSSGRRPVRALAAAALALGIVFIYGAVAVLWDASGAGQAASAREAMSQAAWGMVGQDTATVPGDFSRGLVATLTVATVLTLAALAWTVLRPPASGSTSSESEWREARHLVETAGDDSLAYFALRRDKRYFFDETHSVFLAFRALSGIALVSGDPIGDQARSPALLEEFATHCRRHAWRMAAIGVGAEARPLWESVGLKTIYVGDEAVVLPSSFSLDGRAIRKVRQSVNRLEHLGYLAEMRRAHELDGDTREALVHVSETWRGGQPERGFSMALDDVRSDELDDTLFVLGRDADGRLAGFLHFVPVPATGDLSLSAMRRLPETPNGFNEFLVSSLLHWARDQGIARVSLNFAVFGSLLREEGASAGTRVARTALRYADRFFQLERLLAFNRKFKPEWQPRYLAVESLADVPNAALVLLRLEKLLPTRRGAAAETPAQETVTIS